MLVNGSGQKYKFCEGGLLVTVVKVPSTSIFSTAARIAVTRLVHHSKSFELFEHNNRFLICRFPGLPGICGLVEDFRECALAPKEHLFMLLLLRSICSSALKATTLCSRKSTIATLGAVRESQQPPGWAGDPKWSTAWKHFWHCSPEEQCSALKFLFHSPSCPKAIESKPWLLHTRERSHCG